MRNKIQNLLKEKVITDIISVGFVDIENDIAQFYSNPQWLYFEFDDYYIEFESIEQFSKLKIQFLDSINYSYEIDKDMVKAKSSIIDLVLISSMVSGNNINEICFVNINSEEDEFIVCDALKLILSNGQIIFLDPSFLFGIAIGKEDQEEFWKNNLNGNYIINETNIYYVYT